MFSYFQCRALYQLLSSVGTIIFLYIFGLIEMVKCIFLAVSFFKSARLRFTSLKMFDNFVHKLLALPVPWTTTQISRYFILPHWYCFLRIQLPHFYIYFKLWSHLKAVGIVCYILCDLFEICFPNIFSSSLQLFTLLVYYEH